MSATARVISRLDELKFRCETEHLDFFGDTLPLLKAIAVDDRAHQLVLVADERGVPEDEHEGSWNELLFAISGLRHHLRGAGAPALGSPILLAVVDGPGADRLYRIAEDIAEDYALFTRVDINVVDADKVEAEADGALDIALSSLLPNVRRAIDGEITVATQDVERFWQELGDEIRGAALKLQDSFGDLVPAAAATELLGALRGTDKRDPASVRRARPISSLTLENFRSFEQATRALPPMAVVQGVNGSGKSSICEAMEILWSGRTQRIPDDVDDLGVYEKHLNHDGHSFALGCSFGFEGQGTEPHEVTALDDSAAIPLGRTVLAQHMLTDMASGAPRKRYRAFLNASGLDFPELDDKAERLRRAAFDEANEVLAKVGMAPMTAVSRNGVEHLRRGLGCGFVAKLPSSEPLLGAAEALDRVTAGAFLSRRIGLDSKLPKLLAEADSALLEVQAAFEQAPDPTPQVERVLAALRAEAGHLRSLADPLRILSQQFSRRFPPPLAEEVEEVVQSSQLPVPYEMAARWLTQARGLERSVRDLEDLVPEIEDDAWRKRLKRYIAALRTAVERSSADELETLAATPQAIPRSAPIVVEPDPELLHASGFSRAPEVSRPVVAAMGEMQAQLSDRAAQLDTLAAELERHPARGFVSHAARLLPVICRFELTRELLRSNGALVRARGTLVSDLLDERLFPVVRELVAALVRFEWYFDPLQLIVGRQELRIFGGPNSDPELDVRMLLNAAERTVVGIAWFLALHILQPKQDRKVLVLDDPASGFDAMNKAAFVATLRSVAHLLKPEQLLITTHDDVLVALLEQEFAPVAGWPRAVGFLRCQRSGARASKIEREEEREEQLGAADLGGELRKLGFEEVEEIPSPA